MSKTLFVMMVGRGLLKSQSKLTPHSDSTVHVIIVETTKPTTNHGTVTINKTAVKEQGCYFWKLSDFSL